MHFEIAGNQLGFRAWAVLSSLVLGVLCLFAGTFVVLSQHFAETFDTDLPGVVKLGLRYGLTAIVVAWCGYMALLGWAASLERPRAWQQCLLVAWVLFAGGYMGLVTLGFLGTLFR